MIYPMSDGDFLACYLTPDFMALSFQKKLVEDVIDAYKKGDSLAMILLSPKCARQKKSTGCRHHLYPCGTG